MVQVNTGKSQLSGWGHGAEPEFLFINKVPRPFMLGETISAAATREAGGTELHFTDGTILLYLVQNGLLPALENVTVWTVPSEGTTVSNTLEYVEIYASYTTKKGKVLKAGPVKVAVIKPVAIRVVTAANYKPKEAYFNADSDLYDEDLMPLDKSKYKTYALYTAVGGNEVVYTEEIAPTYTRQLFSQYGGGYHWVYGIAAKSNRQEDITVYHSVDTPSTETFDYAFYIQATATVGGLSFTDTTYFDSMPITRFEYNFPTEYDTHLLKNGGIQFRYADDSLITPTPDLSNMWLYFSSEEPTAYSVTPNKHVTLAEGNEGDIWLVRANPRHSDGEPRYESTQYHYVCSGGTTTWTRVE